jgi:hypothetical protein
MKHRKIKYSTFCGEALGTAGVDRGHIFELSVILNVLA